jgi:small conductance mechanosensitive channel
VSVKDQIVSFLVVYGFKILGAIAIFIAGYFAAGFLGKLLKKLLTRFHLEPPVESLLVFLVRLLVLVMAGVVAASSAGVNISPLVAGIGVVGVGIGLATQGVLSNLVAGLVIMFVKPFRVTEYIELLGVEGVVETITLFSTKLRHFDKSIVVIPNKKIVGEILHNYGTIRQLELSIGIGYNSDLDQAEAAIRRALSQNPRVLQDPAPALGVSSLADSSISWNVKPWVKVQDFTAAPGELYSAMVKNLAAVGIEMPFPQREIRILNEGIPANNPRIPAGI